MLDPSLFVSRQSFSVVEEVLEGGAERYTAPATFLNHVRSGDVASPVLEFFGAPRVFPFQAERFTARVRTATERLEPWRPDRQAEGPAGYQPLTLEGDSQLVAILEEEWSFLHEQSWIASRTRNAFDAFIQAGGVAVEFGREQFDSVVARTLARTGHPVPADLSRTHRLRAVAKWVAGGGPEWTAFVDPALAGVLGTMGLAYFFLFDP
jgi:hypothetical protein